MSAPSSSSNRTMRAVLLESYGKPPSQHVKLSTIPVPSLPSPSHLLIRVLSAAINPIDKAIITGDMQSLLPLTLPTPVGFDVAGIVDQVGSSVTQFKVGDSVFARVDHDRMGTLAEYVATSEESVAKKPNSASFDEAASLPLVSLTALQAMRDIGGLAPGQKVLITGGGGGVGTAATQIASILGASEVVTTVGSDFNRSLTLGASKTIDYKNEKFGEAVSGMDLVLDTTGEATTAFSTLKSGGTCVSIIAALTASSMKAAGLEVPLAAQAYLAATSAPVIAAATLKGVSYRSCWMKPNGSELAEVAQWVDEKKMKAVVDKVYKLEEVGAALDYLAEGHAKGKIVIHVADQ